MAIRNEPTKNFLKTNTVDKYGLILYIRAHIQINKYVFNAAVNLPCQKEVAI